MRSKPVLFTLNEETIALLNALRRETGKNKSALVRRAIELLSNTYQKHCQGEEAKDGA